MSERIITGLTIIALAVALIFALITPAKAESFNFPPCEIYRPPSKCPVVPVEPRPLTPAELAAILLLLLD